MLRSTALGEKSIFESQAYRWINKQSLISIHAYFMTNKKNKQTKKQKKKNEMVASVLDLTQRQYGESHGA